MKTKSKLLALALLALLSTINYQLSTAFAQGTAFTYQGQLQKNGSLANGNYDLTFALFTDSGGVNQNGATVTNSAVGVTNGLFTITLDFGPGIFNGESLWLEIGVETNGGGGFTTLSPLQQLTPAPYAIYSTAAGSASTATTASSANQATTATTANGVAAGSVTGVGIASGSVVKNLNGLQDAVTLAPGANVTITPSGNTLTIASSAGGAGGNNSWSLTGNSGTIPGVNFLGTIDNEAFQLWVADTPALRIVPTGLPGSPNIIAGSPLNYMPSYVEGGTIGGGGDFNGTNSVMSDFGTIGGGAGNIVNATDELEGGASTVGGGLENTASGDDSTIGGGFANNAWGDYSALIGGYENYSTGQYATEGGGYQNDATGQDSVVGGGQSNQGSGADTVIAGGFSNMASGRGASTIGGGGDNNVSGAFTTIAGGEGNNGSGDYSTIPGGGTNAAVGRASFAAGAFATANYNDSFVWGDGSRGAFDNAPNQFDVLATGGAYFYTSTSGTSVAIDTNSDIDFGTTVRQMLNLFNTPGAPNNYGIGIQTGTMYFRCGSDVPYTGFAWYQGGSPNSGSFNNGGGTTLMVLTNGGLVVKGTFVSASDRNMKENFSDVDSSAVLEKVSALPIQNWNYKDDAGTRHIGPMAQDFYAAFRVGPDDKHITVVDEGGVALAAIQGLDQKVDAGSQKSEARIQKLETENAQLQERNDSLEKRLVALEQFVLKQKAN